ncbi:UDP-glucose 4-epimerase GalE [Escherichia coli]|nr:UDP-glucose 4-epimerase GalE [Escherichia coli]EFK6067339.1 UDP-glucose 4-epimerase GalE [Escherichia coli]EHO1090690.1 UDP-glucose 4-epimerase GalE [Escherichia coli]ELT2024200.1 UDP-glucose 4-epimerase GalE [Escherichia coli]
MAILVTGGAGYIGSHTVLMLLKEQYEVIVLDNFHNSSVESLHRVKEITGSDICIINGDIRDRVILKSIFTENSITDVIHFAGLKSVSDSIQFPTEYYDNNVYGTLVLIEEMISNNIKNLIFSSSVTVYGTPEKIPVKETFPVGGTTNPYGTSKLMVENILHDVSLAYPFFRTTILRYFNPVGAHPSGKIGEDPNGIPNNLMPYICSVASGKYKQLSIYGNDYETKDGTGVRDFIHVMDLANGHIAALKHRDEGSNYKVYNLGTGHGYSVLELLAAFQRITSVNIPYVLVERRAGDIAECWSDPSKAYLELGWKACLGLDEMVRDAWNWQQSNPDGYKFSEKN